jgi:HEAT repeat protein
MFFAYMKGDLEMRDKYLFKVKLLCLFVIIMLANVNSVIATDIEVKQSLKDEINKLIEVIKLNDKNQEESIMKLHEISKEGYPYLVSILKDKSSSQIERVIIIGALSGIRNQVVVSTMIKLLDDEDKVIRSLAAGYFQGNPDESASQALIKIISNKNEDDNVIINASIALAKIGSPETISAFLEMFKYKNEKVRRLLRIAFLNITDKRSIKVLLSALNTDDKVLKENILNVFYRMREKSVIPHLKDMLKKEKEKDLQATITKVIEDISNEKSQYIHKKQNNIEIEIIKGSKKELVLECNEIDNIQLENSINSYISKEKINQNDNIIVIIKITEKAKIPYNEIPLLIKEYFKKYTKNVVINFQAKN